MKRKWWLSRMQTPYSGRMALTGLEDSRSMSVRLWSWFAVFADRLLPDMIGQGFAKGLAAVLRESD
ncbi:MAG: hypothetical protein HN763_00060 [Opitutales bacterium]|nr:hypothetical protein [Opitutales bacterium]MBT7864737.1 hypothetical protein [Opitutales bacterium]